MRLPFFQVDAFANRVFEGNPAAVCPLEAWPDDALMQTIAAENNLAETAFFVPEKRGGVEGFHLRWFTPAVEVEFCGHATLASGFVLFDALDYSGEEIIFFTRRGVLKVRRGEGKRLAMDFPLEDCKPAPTPDALVQALGAQPEALFEGANFMAVFEHQKQVAALAPDMAALKAFLAPQNRGLIATAKADSPDYHFVSRFFAPAHGIDEDHATGSAHAMLAPFWGARLQQTQLNARQISPRGASLFCNLAAEKGRFILEGEAQLVIKGDIETG